MTKEILNKLADLNSLTNQLNELHADTPANLQEDATLILREISSESEGLLEEFLANLNFTKLEEYNDESEMVEEIKQIIVSLPDFYENLSKKQPFEFDKHFKLLEKTIVSCEYIAGNFIFETLWFEDKKDDLITGLLNASNFSDYVLILENEIKKIKVTKLVCMMAKMLKHDFDDNQEFFTSKFSDLKLVKFTTSWTAKFDAENIDLPHKQMINLSTLVNQLADVTDHSINEMLFDCRTSGEISQKDLKFVHDFTKIVEEFKTEYLQNSEQEFVNYQLNLDKFADLYPVAHDYYVKQTEHIDVVDLELMNILEQLNVLDCEADLFNIEECLYAANQLCNRAVKLLRSI